MSPAACASAAAVSAANFSSSAAVIALRDEHSVNRASAAEALCAMGRIEPGRAALVKELESETHSYALQYLINAIIRTGAVDAIPEGWADKALKAKGQNDYVKRFAQRIKKGEL